MSKRYRVSGASAFLGHGPGETFSADLAPDQEARAIARGSIVRDSAKGQSQQEGSPSGDRPATAPQTPSPKE